MNEEIKNTEKEMKKTPKLVFTADKEYTFVFTSQPFEYDGETVRWSYDNCVGDSAYDKSRCAWTGKRCNFNQIRLEYKTDREGIYKWITWEEFEPCVTKKSMLNMMNHYMGGSK